MVRTRARWAAVLGAAAAAGAVGVGRAVAGRRRQRQPEKRNGWYVVHRGVTVDRPVEAVIGFCKDPERLNRVLGGWARLEQIAPDRWRCVVHLADGGVAWRAELTVERYGGLRWEVVGGPMPQRGRVDLVPAPQDRGTEIRAELCYRARGPVRRALGLARGDDPDLRLRDTLRRVKALIECGQVIDTRRDPSGRGPGQEKATDIVRDKLTTGGRA